jgi:hypothetical protein
MRRHPPKMMSNGGKNNNIIIIREYFSMPMDEIPEGTKWIGAMNVRQMSPSKRPISDKVILKFYF